MEWLYGSPEQGDSEALATWTSVRISFAAPFLLFACMICFNFVIACWLYCFNVDVFVCFFVFKYSVKSSNVFCLYYMPNWNNVLLTYLDVLCISLFAIHGLRVLPIGIFLFYVPLLNESNSLYVNKATQNILKQNRTLMCLDNFVYFCIVLCILLIISGVEQNPGPSLSESSRSFSSVSDLSSDCSVFKNNVSFLHLNVQSIVLKLDIITAEYSSYDILSFTESWLKPNINDEIPPIPTRQKT